MDETTGKMGSALAITEKRPHRPGGCVGIFFQLFDWNRRFAKKKLFSRKLLVQARGKQVSKKFGGDEKMPKTEIHLIADENSGGFPSGKKNGSRSSIDSHPKHEMRAPGLVARLMGLESMPAMHKDKPKKPTFSGFCGDRQQKFCDEHSGSSRKDLKLDKSCAKVEPRPQKIQKTKQSERQAVTRFRAEALQIKSVLSRSKKHHHPKFASPIRSPRFSSARNVSRNSRLIDAATKILEPGLLATIRAKSALTYSSSTLYEAKDVVLAGNQIEVLSPDLPQSNNNVTKSVVGQTSCRNCGNMLDVVHSRPNVEEQPVVYSSSASNFINVASPGLGKGKLESSGSFSDEERDVDFRQWQPISPYALEKNNNNTRQGSVLSPDRKPSLQEGEAQWNLTSQQCKPQNEEPSSFTFKQRTQPQNQMSLCRDRMPPKAKLSNHPSRRVSSVTNTASGVKDFVALNRNLSGRNRPRVPSKVGNSSFDAEIKSCNQQDNSLPQLRTPIRKRRTISAGGQTEGVGFINSTIGRQRNLRCSTVTGKVKGLNACSMDQTSIKSKASCERNGIGASGSKDVISFTFNSRLRHKTGNAINTNEKTKDPSDIISENTYWRTLEDEHDGISSLEKKLPLTGDALGALLEQKLKELTSQKEDELITACTSPKRSTALILQELISALTQEQPISLDGRVVDADVPCLTKAKTKGTLVGFAHDVDHLSPGSVLEASFSNDSCVSSSLDDSSAIRPQLDLMDYSQDHLQPADLDLIDSATSLSKRSAGNQIVIDLINQISILLHSVDYVELGLTGSKLSHAQDAILNAELLFGNTGLHKSGGMTDFLVAPFLLDELKFLASAMQSKFNCCLGFEATKEGNQLRGFLFDSWLECLDVKYGRYFNSGFKAWTRLPLRMKAEILIREVGEEVIRWTHLAGMTSDEIIEYEMRLSLGKWTKFDREVFETGAQIGLDILDLMIEEIVIDLKECRLVSF